MTVIFANNHDIDCETLPKIWEGQPNINLIETIVLVIFAAIMVFAEYMARKK